MVKLIALYKTPPDVELFERHYFSVHLPLVENIPGLLKAEVTRISGSPFGNTDFHLMAEMYFESADAMNAANASKEGRAAAKDLMGFAGGIVTLLTGEVR
ncbi:MAG TPA: EthD family reductase [Bacteroidota bacterium]|nr:EthD family reductase [Bacteroidota bacterium]